MKKVGVVTFHMAENSGAVLQCIALQKKLKDLGADPYVIDYRPKYLRDQYRVFINPFCKTGHDGVSLRSFLAYTKQNLFFYRKVSRKKKFDSFIKQWMTVSKRYNSYVELVSDPPKADVYIAGSDQIWNCSLTGETYDPVYFLKFGEKNTKKYTYAISLGKPVDQVANDIIPLTREIDEMSFREKSVYDYFKENLSVNNIHNSIDPTLLINEKEWLHFVAPRLVKSPYVLVYALERNKMFASTLETILKKSPDLKVIDISQCNLYLKNTNRRLGFSPDEFLSYIYNAQYILTNSFHCTVFSLIFHKQFVSIPHMKSNQRIADLLSVLGMDNRVVTSNSFDLDKVVQWNLVDEWIENLRKPSVAYLYGIVRD